jgi:hypothetical protein
LDAKGDKLIFSSINKSKDKEETEKNKANNILSEKMDC